MRIFGDPTITLLHKGLDAQVLRQKAAAKNVANIDTPGYKKERVVFEQVLDRTLNGGATVGVEPRVVRDNRPSLRPDGNNVDLEEEMIELSANSLMYNTTTQCLKKHIAVLREVITGRR
ncbi:flagellar basal body rod protein FlgB [Desulforudis sp. DRI-14]|uniref:flagellar basal body rod protein FlgB n=1 Tax=Desulforudis sp. DRI-14 TaxID=3459793 RepID=UPI0040421A7F